MEATQGRTELIKIVEAALSGDTAKARRYVTRYIVKYPHTDLFKPFESLLNGDNNPSGLHLDTAITGG